VIDRGDTAFMLVCAALVLFMTPGLDLVEHCEKGYHELL